MMPLTTDTWLRRASRIGQSIYARCFTGWARPPSWCTLCVTLDHDTADCPYASTARLASPYCTKQEELVLDPLPKYAPSASNTISITGTVDTEISANSIMFAVSAKGLIPASSVSKSKVTLGKKKSNRRVMWTGRDNIIIIAARYNITYQVYV